MIIYSNKGHIKTFSVVQALKDGWGKDWEGEKALVGLKLVDRLDSTHLVEVANVNWNLGILFIYFKEGGYLSIDHAIQQFECLN